MIIWIYDLMHQLSEENLFISKITVDEGPKLKRWHPMSRGRAYPILKRSSHIAIVLSEMNPTVKEIKENKKEGKVGKPALKSVKSKEVKQVKKPAPKGARLAQAKGRAATKK